MKIRLLSDAHYPDHVMTATSAKGEENLNNMDFLFSYDHPETFSQLRDNYYKHLFKTYFNGQANYYISLGDLTNIGSKSEYEAIANLIPEDKKGHFINIFGNHDSYVQIKEDIMRHHPLKRYFSLVEDNICLIFLDTSRDKDMADWSGDVEEEQLEWLKITLKANSSRTILVFSHHPIHNTTDYSTFERMSVLEDNPIKEILFQHKKEAFFFNGHVHVDSYVKQGNWNFIQVGSVLEQGIIRELVIDEDQVTLTSQILDPHYRHLGIWLASVMDHYTLTPLSMNVKSLEKLSIKIK